jgi:hypothetical protein
MIPSKDFGANSKIKTETSHQIKWTSKKVKASWRRDTKVYSWTKSWAGGRRGGGNAEQKRDRYIKLKELDRPWNRVMHTKNKQKKKKRSLLDCKEEEHDGWTDSLRLLPSRIVNNSCLQNSNCNGVAELNVGNVSVFWRNPWCLLHWQSWHSFSFSRRGFSKQQFPWRLCRRPGFEFLQSHA